jgi:hypothetical protein
MTILHHYTTPIQARDIETRGLEPRSVLPGTTRPVTLAYLTEAHLAWPSMRHDENPGLAQLFLLSLDAKREGAGGLVEVTFHAPPETMVYDAAALERGVESYLRSRRVAGEDLRFMRKPHAAVTETIEHDALTLRTMTTDELDALFNEYGFFQR